VKLGAAAAQLYPPFAQPHGPVSSVPVIESSRLSAASKTVGKLPPSGVELQAAPRRRVCPSSRHPAPGGQLRHLPGLEILDNAERQARAVPVSWRGGGSDEAPPSIKAKLRWASGKAAALAGGPDAAATPWARWPQPKSGIKKGIAEETARLRPSWALRSAALKGARLNTRRNVGFLKAGAAGQGSPQPTS